MNEVTWLEETATRVEWDVIVWRRLVDPAWFPTAWCYLVFGVRNNVVDDCVENDVAKLARSNTAVVGNES